MPKDVYLQPHAPDPVLDPGLVLSLTRRHIPRADAVTQVDESGGEARVYVIDDGIIVKTQRPHRLRPRTSLAKEVAFLQALQPSGASVPEVLGYGKDESVEYTVMTRIPGVAVVHASLDAEARHNMLFELGRTLRSIHGIPQEPLRATDLFPVEDTPEAFSAHVSEALEDAVAHLREAEAPWDIPHLSPEQIAQLAVDALPRTTLRAAVHSNPGPTHTFVDPISGAYEGLIDFGDAFISHPAWDLRRWNPTEREALLAGYQADAPLDADFLQTYRIIAIAMNLVMLTSQKPLVRQAAQADLVENLRALQ